MSAPYAKVEESLQDDNNAVMPDDYSLPIAMAIPAEDEDDLLAPLPLPPPSINPEFNPATALLPQEILPVSLVRVYAPCRLPPNYKLTVRLDDHDDDDNDNDNHFFLLFDVLVPETGVSAGQTFVTERLPSKPIRGHWSDSLLDCFSSNNNGCVFFSAWCCDGVVYAALMEGLRLDWLGRPSRPETYRRTFGIVCLLWFSLVLYPVVNVFTLGLLSLVVWMIPFYVLWIRTRTRMLARERYRIQGSCLADVCVVLWCSCCAALQMHRHMKRSRDPARPFTVVGHAEVV